MLASIPVSDILDCATMLYVTTSWDDGDTLDRKLGRLLSRYGVKGTFYVAKEYRKERLSEEEIRVLSKAHEVGAHTLTHPDLCKLLKEEKVREIRGSKEWLQGVTAGEVPMFCYPSGYFDEATAELVREAGFRGARTTIASKIDLPTSAYEVPTTLQVYPFPFRKNLRGGYYWRRLLEPLRERYSLYRALGVPRSRMTSWLSVAKSAFDHSQKHGEVFHLWGHSWELEAYGMWDDLEKLLAYIARHKNIRFVTNSELLTAAELPTIETVIPSEHIGGSWVTGGDLTADSIIYSFGVGEDISWDKVLIEKYNLTVHAFDPTPKSIVWLKEQKLPKYFIFYEYGIGPQDGMQHFAEPLKPHWVSYSTAREGKGVEAPVKRLQTIMRELGHTYIAVLKMDIEGGEYEVIDDMFASKIFPKQLLVEFHHRWKGLGIHKTKGAIEKLHEAGYKIFYISPNGEEYSFIFNS